jgi:hypothetical protein
MAYAIAPAYGLGVVFALCVALLVGFSSLYIYTFVNHHGRTASRHP